MQIRKVRYQNFYSAKDITIDFDKYSGITLIDGKNGAGKSIIFESIIFAITGRTIRKSTEEAMVNAKTGKNLCVEIWIDDDVYIKRTKRPTSLEFKVGEDNRTKENATETQKAIESHLGTNYKVLMASMVFGQHNDVEFLAASTDDKRTIIRNFLNLDEVFEVRDKIKDFKSEYQTTRKSAEAAIEENEKQQKGIKAKLDAIPDDIKLPEITLEEILKLEEKKKLLTEQYNSIFYGSYQSTQFSISSLESEIEIGAYKRKKNCSSCGQPTIEEVTYNEIAIKINTLEILKEQLAELEKSLKRIDNSIKKIKIPISSNEYAAMSEKIEQKKLRDNYAEQIKDLEARSIKLHEKKSKAIEAYEVMRFWEKAFSEQGIIKYVIKNILKRFNDSCNTYLYTLANGQYYIKFDEQLKEEIWTEKTKIVYHSLSGGQKRKINLAVMLALQDLLQLTGTNRTDLLFFDEIGENLDPDSLYGLYIFLRQIKKEGKKVFLVTHNEQLKSLLDFNNRIKMKLRNGETVIEGKK